MIKLSKLGNDVKVITNDLTVYDVGEINNDLKYFKDENKKLYTTTEYQASIDARNMLESALESESDNMYEDWYERIVDDITDEDVKKLQDIVDDIINRSQDQNIAYYKNKEIDVDI